MQKSILSLIVLLILTVTHTFSQKNDKDEKLRESLEKSQSEELTRQQQERTEQARREQQGQTTRNFEIAPDKSLLPDNPYSWVLHIITTGGFTGRGKPTVTITSNSEFACGEDETLQFQPLDGNQFQPLADIISKANFTLKDLSFNQPSEIKGICNDCYQTSVILIRREGSKKINIYKSTSDKIKFQTFAENFNQIKQRAAELAVCQN
jgi:hypothetical protein